MAGKPRVGGTKCIVRTHKCSCGGTPHPAPPKLTSFAKAPHPSPTRGEETMTRRLDELAEARLAELAEGGRLRRLRPYRREGTDVIRSDGARLVDFSGNDYLGL